MNYFILFLISSQPLHSLKIKNNALELQKQFNQKKSQEIKEDYTGLFDTSIRNDFVQKYLKIQRQKALKRKLITIPLLNVKVKGFTILMTVIIYLLLTFRVWGGEFYHNPYKAPYGFMSGRRLKLQQIGKKNLRKLKQTSFFQCDIKQTKAQIYRFLRDEKYDETIFLNEQKLFDIFSKFFKKQFGVHDIKVQRYLRKNVRYFYQHKQKILESLKLKKQQLIKY